MAHRQRIGLRLAALLFVSMGAAAAQTPVAGSSASRLAGNWRSSPPVTITASRAPALSGAVSATTLGAAPANARLDRMILLLEPSAAQQQALTAVIQSQQNPSSSAYHQWLSPAAFAVAYSNSAADVSAVGDWLRSQGFDVAALPAGRGWIEFSGTVAQVEQAFGTHVVMVPTASGLRAALAGDISVPGALQPVIYGLVSLDGVLSAPAMTTPQPLSATAAELAAATSLDQAAAATPRLMTNLLQLDALHAAGTTGAGESIALATRSNVNLADVVAFRAAFGLPANAPQIVLNGTDPGRTADEAEALLEASWAGAAAPGAQVVLVPAASTGATDGLDLSLAAIVDQALAHTVLVGYSACEAGMSEAHQAFYAALYRQAAAEGIAMVAAAGDSGSAACYAAGSTVPVTSGYGVNALASTPWNVAVGADAFGTAGPAAGVSGLAAWSPVSAADTAYAGGGGSSAVYAAPGWQPAPGGSLPARAQMATGAATPAMAAATSLLQQLKSAGLSSGYRLIPDLSLPTAIDSVENHGLAFCMSGDASATTCTPVQAGGSSAAAALFSGLAALLAQEYGPQGNLAPRLYELSESSAASSIFSDVQQGTAQLACAAGSPGCTATGQIGFAAAAGYDMTSGLGTVNAQALARQWPRAQVGTGSVTVLNTIPPGQTINPSGSLVLSATVTAPTGDPAPTGTVAFLDQSNGSADLSNVTLVPGSGTSATASTIITGALTQGGHNIFVQYSGDTNYAVATDPNPVTVEVQPSSTSTVISPATYTPNPGSTLVVTATVTSSTAGAGASPPSGTVNFLMNGVIKGTEPVIQGTPSTASINLTMPNTAGAVQLSGYYSGDTNYYNSTSQPVQVTVPTSAPTVTVTASPSAPVVGGTVQLTAIIAPPAGNTTPPTGTVIFYVDGIAAGGSVLVIPGSPSTASLTINTPALGQHAITASYSGDTNYAGITSPAASLVAGKTPTAVTLMPSITNPAGGSSVMLTATISASYPGTEVPSGTVTFTMDSSTVEGTVAVVSGTTATLSVTMPMYGAHTFVATYNGDAYFSASSSPPAAVSVAKIVTTTAISPATSSPSAGTPLVVTATVSPASTLPSLPSGTVTFTLDGASIGSSAVVSGSPATTAITIPAASITPGQHVLLAVYNGDTYYATSTSTPVTITVPKSPSAITITPASYAPTVGGILRVAAVVTATTYGSSGPSGTVTILMDGASAGTATLAAGIPSTVNIPISMLTAGNHVLTASYSGDNYYAASSTTSSVNLVASRGPTAITLAASPATLTAGMNETLTATVTPINPVTGTIYTITGTVSFYDSGSHLLGTASLINNVATLSGVALANNVNHSITAVYSGDVNWLPSTTSTPLVLTATTLPVMVVLTANVTTASPGQAVILTATVTPTAPPASTVEQNPTGEVVFYNGTTVLGESALAAVALTNSSVATLTLANLPGGQDVITATYLGDLSYDAGSSNSLTLTIQDFTITPDPSNPATNLTLVQGTSGSAAYDITGLGGFNNQIQVVCAVSATDLPMTCTPSPQQVTPNATVTFVIQTYASGATASTRPGQRPFWPRAAGGAALALLAFFFLPFGRRAHIFADKSARRFGILLLLLVGLGGVGMGCSSVALQGTSSASGGTPLGVSTLKITASDYVNNTVFSRSVYLTVNVVP